MTDVAVDVCVGYTNYFRFALPMAARGPGTFHARDTIFWTLTFARLMGCELPVHSVHCPGIFASIGSPPTVGPSARPLAVSLRPVQS